MKKDRIIIGVGVIVESNGKVLCVREKQSNAKLDKEVGMIGFPSGHVLFDEDIFESGKREVLEETGYNVEIIDIIGFYLVKGALGIGLRGKLIEQPYQFTKPEDIEEIMWLSNDEFFESITRPGQTAVLRDYLDGKSIEKRIINDYR